MPVVEIQSRQAAEAGAGLMAEIQQGRLAAMIVSPDDCKGSLYLRGSHYPTGVYGEINDSILGCWEREEVVTAALLARKFENHHDLKDVGGGRHIHDIVDNIISVKNAAAYAKAIYEDHCRRVLEARAAACDGSPESLEVTAKLLMELANVGSSTRPRRLKPYSWQELQSLPKRSPLIKGVLDRRGMSVIYGESNSGKTFLTLDMALHIALGSPWFERRIQQGKVLYIAAEGGLGLTERLQAFWLHHKLTDNPPLYLIPASIDLCSASADAGEIIREAKALEGVELIVIDTLSRAMAGGNENSPDDMGAFVKNCDLIREQSGAHVLIVHHAGKDASKGGRGHSSLRAAVDTEIEVTNDSGTITAEIKKQRDGRTGDRFSFVLESIHLGSDDDGEPVSSCVLVPTDEPAGQRSQKKRLSPALTRAVAVLNDLMVESGESLIPKKGMQKLIVVRTADFRTALSKSNITASDKPDNVRRQIQRVIEDLNNKGVTATWEDMTWLVGQTGQ